MSTYTTKLDMQTGTINICGGDTRFQFVIDEVPEIIESLKSEYERAKAIMGNPLLNASSIDEALKHYYSVVSNGGHHPSTLKAMVEFYQNTLVMLSQWESTLCEVIQLLASTEARMLDDLPEYAITVRVYEQLAAILEAHKQHMPVEGE